MLRPNFLGLGVEKAGTSWIFACLYEHPEVCIPVKEINFFSDFNKWQKGKTWYETFFQNRCPNGKLSGEFSTAYFYDLQSPARINALYPNIKMIVCLRDPIRRAYSNFINDIKAGTISPNRTFKNAIKHQQYYIEQGKYKRQFDRYFKYFKREQIKIMLYDDLANDPLAFIQSIYSFLEIDKKFVPPSLYQKINTGRIPGNVFIEKLSNKVAHFLQGYSLGEKIWRVVKKSKIPELIRNKNTVPHHLNGIDKETFKYLIEIFREDVTYVEILLNRKLNWLLEKDN